MHYDFAIIGSGPGGHAAAIAAARRGLRTALIDRADWGGVCLNVGCIPTKALITVAHALQRIRQAGRLGIRAPSPELDFPAVRARNQRIISSLRDGLLQLLKHHGVELIRGEASFQDAHRLAVTQDGKTTSLSADRFIIATGASPSPGPWSFDGQRILSYRDLLSLETLPRSLLIVGGGVIGCEFASCLSAFGVSVLLVEQQPQLLPLEDADAARMLGRALAARGVTALTQTTIQTLEPSSAGVNATLSSGQQVEAERCLVAIGLRPNTAGLGLERLGIQAERGIPVDAHLKTSQPHIAAIGDCVPGHGLAHVAAAEGVLAVRNLVEPQPGSLDLRRVPRCVYTDPELAHVGATEAELTQAYRVSRFSFGALGKSLCDEEPEGFVKMLVHQETDQVLGVTILGAQASNLIHLGVLAIHHGLTARQLAGTITAHPTLAEGVTEAAAQIYGEALYTTQGGRLKEARWQLS